MTIVFLGKRGAGVRFIQLFKNYEKSHPEVNFNYLISRSCLKRNPSIALGSLTVNTLDNFLLLIAAPIILVTQILTFIRLTKFRRHVFIFVLPSPSDYLLLRILRIFKFPIVIFIHDENHHSGELWPNKQSIEFRLRLGSRVIVLSEFMRLRLSNLVYGEIYLVEHPIFQITQTHLIKEKLDLPSNFFLFVGRIREYKGIPDLLKAFEMIQSQVSLVIAGEGNLPRVLDRRVKVINRWLTDAEIELLIAKARCVIFPYRDASQSGLIPMCTALNKKLIVSDAGALFEQAKNLDGIRVFKAGDINSLCSEMKGVLGETPTLELSIDSMFEEAIKSAEISGHEFIRQIIEISRFD